MEVMDFVKEYFKNEVEAIAHYNGYISKYKLESPDLNYLDIFKFLEYAYNFLHEIDMDVTKGLSSKLFKNIKLLLDARNLVNKRNSTSVFYKDYLYTLPNYRTLLKELQEVEDQIKGYETILEKASKELESLSKEENGSKKYKKLKREYVDAIHEIGTLRNKKVEIKDELKAIEEKELKIFIKEFDYFKGDIINELEKILNVFIYYFDKLLWYKASRSENVKHFFIKSSIEGEIDSKTFLEYQLKNIDETQSFNGEWISYLKELTKVLL